MECNICGCHNFKDMGNRKGVQCKDCGSLERTRLLWLYIEQLDILSSGSKVLHFAPELGLSKRILGVINPENYVSADFAPENFSQIPNIKKFDLTVDVETLESNSFDLILHSHVLEHIPCNLAHTFFHLHRILTPEGIHACVIPFLSGSWDESFSPELSAEVRIKRFGQSDHVRRIGQLDADVTIGKVVDIQKYIKFDVTKDFSVEVLRRFNIPEYHWYGLNSGTPLIFGKNDYLLTY